MTPVAFHYCSIPDHPINLRMNRFRKHKKDKEKAKEASAALESGPAPTPAPAPASAPLGFSLNPLKMKDSPEPAPQLDLSSALPSSDNFRTSLLMPKLSARFSMLKEQDDPTSILGKASDDSVLFPKRASRLNLLGHNPSTLADIDELSDGSRPSVALGRTDSYASGGDGVYGGYGTDDDRSQNNQSGSIMSRARRAEGNNLFGGRQKVYRIPVRSPSGVAPPTESSRGMGKAVYEHDLNLSAFQRWRNKEKNRAAEDAARESTAHDHEDARSTFSSAQRTTFSSTASGPAIDRTSTAATSIDESQYNSSQAQASAADISVDGRSPSTMSHQKNSSARSRRLYGQGLNQAAQNQQQSMLNRLEGFGRQRAGTPELAMNRNFTKSAGNLRDRMQKLNLPEPTTTSRPTSPPSSATSPQPQIASDNAPKERISPTAALFGGAPPLSPPSSEGDDGAALLAAALNPEDHGKATAMGLFNRPATGFDEQAFAHRQLQMQQGRDTPPLRRPSPPRRPPPQEPLSRPRGLSKSSYRSRAESVSSYYSNDAQHGIDHSRTSSVEASPGRPGARTMYAASTASDSGDETDYGHSLHHSSVTSKPSTLTGDYLETLPEMSYSDHGDLKPIEENDRTDFVRETTPERPDSPVLHGSGLNGIRSHLRTASDKSSIYPLPSPGLPPQQFSSLNKLGTQEIITECSPTSSVADETHEVDAFVSDDHYNQPSPHASFRQSSDVTTSRGSGDSSESVASPINGFAITTSWKEELAYHRQRGESTETQKEREVFALELAERRRKAQEKLRSVAESDSRPSSPKPDRSTSDLKAGNAFSLLKHKSSKQGLPKPDQKNLYTHESHNASSPALGSDEPGRDEDRPSFSFGRQSNSSSPHVSERSFRSRMPTLSRKSREESRGSSCSRGTSPAGPQSRRDRSGSDASASRSKSRTRYRERDDLGTLTENDVIDHENFVMPEDYVPPVPASVPVSTRPSMEVEPLNLDRSSAPSGRLRSLSRPGTGYQYEQPFQLNQQPDLPAVIGATPRPSPAAPAYSANTTPPLNEDQSATTSTSTQDFPQRGPGHANLQKRAIKKKLISDPVFVSTTSNVPLVGLPSGSSQNAGTTPPVPPMNPRRRRGTGIILSALKGEKPEPAQTSSPEPSIADEQSVSPDDEKRPRSRGRLRKTSSEGASLHNRAHQEAMAGPPPAVPQYPPPAVPVDGGMF